MGRYISTIVKLKMPTIVHHREMRVCTYFAAHEDSHAEYLGYYGHVKENDSPKVHHVARRCPHLCPETLGTQRPE